MVFKGCLMSASRVLFATSEKLKKAVATGVYNMLKRTQSRP